ncbi:MAG: DUF1569 domain-containing protein [Pirellulales bacterium]
MSAVDRPVDTKKVARRTLHFNSLDDIVAEAERLAAGSPKMLGNWSLGQTLVHLARAMDMAVETPPFRAPWIVRLIGPLLKKRLLTRPMSSGFKLPKDAAAHLIPTTTSAADGLAVLRRSIDRFKAGPRLPRHDILGRMTDDDWLRLQLRHAELHLSFAAPDGK